MRCSSIQQEAIGFFCAVHVLDGGDIGVKAGILTYRIDEREMTKGVETTGWGNLMSTTKAA